MDPLEDLQVGVITSSLGARVSGTEEAVGCSAESPAHLVGTRPGDEGPSLVTWGASKRDTGRFREELEQLLEQVEPTGCNLEAPLEAAHRFLVDPAPWKSLEAVPCNAGDGAASCVAATGVDETLLEQRAALLRPRAKLLVLFISDENDCSASPAAAEVLELALRPVAAQGALDEETTFPEAASRLRCHDTTARFGTELLFPVSRYVSAFSEVELRPGLGGGPNPLFESSWREVLVVSLIGTPWQDVVRNLDDTRRGLPRAAAQPWGRFLEGQGGEGALDPLNVESTALRTGVHPVTGDALGGEAEGPNAINGFDRAFVADDGVADDLQHACIVKLPQAATCDAGAPTEDCPCASVPNDAGVAPPPDPICEGEGRQAAVKAFPGTRFMQLSKELGASAVLGSSCPRNVDTPGFDYGFRPAVRALLRREEFATE